MRSRTHAEFAPWTSGSFQSRSENIRRPPKQRKRGVRRKPVAKSSRRLEAVTSTSEYKVYHTQPFKRKTKFAGLIHRFETHLNRESLMADLNKNQKINLFSEESKELIRSMGNTEYFELCEITSKIQCPDCFLY